MLGSKQLGKQAGGSLKPELYTQGAPTGGTLIQTQQAIGNRRLRKPTDLSSCTNTSAFHAFKYRLIQASLACHYGSARQFFCDSQLVQLGFMPIDLHRTNSAALYCQHAFV